MYRILANREISIYSNRTVSVLVVAKYSSYYNTKELYSKLMISLSVLHECFTCYPCYLVLLF